MATKIKIFELKPENDEAITKFLAGVNVTQDGFLISEGKLGILYREKDNLGMERDQLAVAASGELSKSQKQFILQEGLVRAYSEMIELSTKKQGEKKIQKEALDAKLKEYGEKWDIELEKKVADLKSQLGAMDKKYKNAGKLQKPEIEKESYALSQELKPLEEKLTAHKKEFDAGKHTLEVELGEVSLEFANLGAIIKENKGLLETAKLDREHAEVFIVSAKKLIAEITEGNLDEKVGALVKE